MSYFAFLCRAAVSATSFTVIGNVCKIITVLINISVWDKHASPLGIGCLLVCLAAAGVIARADAAEFLAVHPAPLRFSLSRDPPCKEKRACQVPHDLPQKTLRSAPPFIRA